MVHNQDYCKQEATIASIKERLDKKHDEIEDLSQKTDNLDVAVTELKVAITELNSTISTFKWFVMAGIGLFGGILVFLMTELIKLI